MMNMHLILAGVLLALGSNLTAANIAGTVDGGGRRTTSANYTMDGSLGGICGTGAGGTMVLKQGYVAQLTEVTNVTLTAASNPVNEGNSNQLTGVACLDDGNSTVLSGSDIKWFIPVSPVGSISPNGLATIVSVCADTAATVSGSYMGVSGSGTFVVLDSIPDNFGLYSGDGLPDSWQAQYYGTNNPNAAPDFDPYGTGDNHFKYVAGLNPTNPASVFTLQLGSVSNRTSWRAVSFNPRLPDRTYLVQCRTNLMSGSFDNLETFSTADNGTERTVTDQDATQLCKFYRVQISYP